MARQGCKPTQAKHHTLCKEHNFGPHRTAASGSRHSTGLAGRMLWALAPRGSLLGSKPAAPGSLSDTQTLGTHPGPTESESIV